MGLAHKFLSFAQVEVPTATIPDMGEQLSLVFPFHFSQRPTVCVMSPHTLFPIKTDNQILLKLKKKKTLRII